jgi:hydrogenase maturation factor
MLLGPGLGEDAAALGLPQGSLIAATDPITLTSTEIGRYAVIINANDVAVMGVRPRWFLAVVLLPTGSTEEVARGIFAAMEDSLRIIGAHLVGGHTEVTEAVSQPVVVGQMLGWSEDGSFVRTGGVRPGDVIVQVGGAPIEGAAVLVEVCGDQLADEHRQAARRALTDPGISVVEQAVRAAGLGATSLHDPTEGGLAAGLHEMAVASAVGLQIDPHKVLWFGAGLEVCRVLEADPWATLASGALLAAFRPEQAEAAVTALTNAGHSAATIGNAVEGTGVVDLDGRTIPWPPRDEVARLSTLVRRQKVPPAATF